MKIALINPPWPHPSDSMLYGVRAGSRWPHFQRRAAPGALPRYVPFPFFMAIAARIMRDAAHEILLIDGVAENIALPELYRRLENFDPRLIFLETSTPSLRHDMTVMAEIRRRHPESKLAAGGTHPAVLAVGLFGRPGAPDYWIAGEYERPLAALADALATGAAVAGIAGISSADMPAGRPGINPDVNALPTPLFEQLPMQNYSDPVCGLPAPVAQSWLSRGCPFGCTFCVWPQVVYGNRAYRPRDVERALDEVEILIRDYGCESFYFDDDTANIGDDRMCRLADAVRRRGLHEYPWSMMARADCMSLPMLDALAGAGIYSIKYGVESSSPALLNACDKATRWDKLMLALQHTRELGIKMHLTFTLGVPGETSDTIRRTVKFAMDIAPDTAQFSICTPFPGTAFYEECRRHGWLAGKGWEQFLGSSAAVVQTPGLSAADLQAGYREALAAWDDFRAARLRDQQAGLVKRLRQAVAGVRRWRLTGDRAGAEFIGQQAPELVPLMLPDDPRDWTPPADAAVVSVIISRHDEEKIFRRWRRARAPAAARALRLFDPQKSS